MITRLFYAAVIFGYSEWYYQLKDIIDTVYYYNKKNYYLFIIIIISLYISLLFSIDGILSILILSY